MSTERPVGAERDMERVVRSWLHEDRYESATRVLDGVLDLVDTTPQRRPWRPAWRVFPPMNTPMKAALAVAAMVVVLVAGYSLLPRLASVGAEPSATPSPTRVATQTPLSTPDPSPLQPGLIHPNDVDGHDLTAGRYRVDTPFPVRLAFTVPDGWAAWAYQSVGSQINLAGDPAEISFEIVDNVSSDPCTDRLLDPPIGPTVDDLVSALSNLKGFQASRVAKVTVDGFHGKRLTLRAPTPPQGCELKTWKTTTRQNRVGAGEVNAVRVIDVDGVRLLICVAYTPPISDANRAQVQGILDSLQIQP